LAEIEGIGFNWLGRGNCFGDGPFLDHLGYGQSFRQRLGWRGRRNGDM
jgi:hypothetical protein